MSLTKQAKTLTKKQVKLVLDAQSQLTDAIRLEDRSAKGKSGGVIYTSNRLAAVLADYADGMELTGTIIKFRSGKAMSAQVITNWFFNLYRGLGFDGCSSHSGRRSAITRWAGNITAAGGSLRDVQQLARHSSLQMTQKYIEVSEGAMKRVVG